MIAESDKSSFGARWTVNLAGASILPPDCEFVLYLFCMNYVNPVLANSSKADSFGRHPRPREHILAVTLARRRIIRRLGLLAAVEVIPHVVPRAPGRGLGI